MPATLDDKPTLLRSDLSARYGDERLPRYTSYPTAPHFSDAVSAQTYRQWLQSIAEDQIGSIYLHMPFCRSMCWYCGCHPTITKKDEPIAAYLEALRREIELVAECIERPLPVNHIHFGGGTPTIISPEQFSGLIHLLERRFVLQPGAEIAVEIDPRTLTPEMIRELGASGVTRASLGVQSFDPVVQRAINRIQSFEETAAATEGLRAAGIRGVNFDLIYGLPHQTAQSCVETVKQALQLAPDRFSVFGYAHVPAFKKHQRKIDEEVLPDGSGRHEQVEAINRALIDAGYRQIGLDHFARGDDSLARAQATGKLHRNFQGYTTDSSDTLIGVGASAIGRLSQGYIQNEIAIRSYCTQIGNNELATRKGYVLTADDRLRADIIERLMCDLGVDLAAVGARHRTAPEPLLQQATRLRPLMDDGIVRVTGSRIAIADDARHLVRSVAAAFDAYIGTSGRTHSRAV